MPFSKTCLGIASNSIRVRAFAYDANDKPGRRQHQQQSPEFREIACIVSKEVQELDEPEPGYGQTEAGAVDVATTPGLSHAVLDRRF
jgi:hypothetical protein